MQRYVPFSNTIFLCLQIERTSEFPIASQRIHTTCKSTALLDASMEIQQGWANSNACHACLVWSARKRAKSCALSRDLLCESAFRYCFTLQIAIFRSLKAPCCCRYGQSDVYKCPVASSCFGATVMNVTAAAAVWTTNADGYYNAKTLADACEEGYAG